MIGFGKRACLPMRSKFGGEEARKPLEDVVGSLNRARRHSDARTRFRKAINTYDLALKINGHFHWA
jgi:hypothetical protein